MTMRLFILASITTLFLLGCGADGESEAERMAGEHAGDTPEATAATGSPALPVDTSRVSYTQTQDGTPITGYFAQPQEADSVLDARGLDPSEGLPGIVVIHEWWGLNDNIRAATRRLAGEGYQVLAVDLYRGSTAEDPEAAQSLMEEAMDRESDLVENIQSAQSYLRAETNASRLAVLGWCFGGGMTFRTVGSLPTSFDAAVVYYGSPNDLTRAQIESIETPILGHFGRQDEAIPIEDVREFASTMEELGKPFQFHEYDAGHAFANPSGTSYEPAAAEQAWDRTTSFLKTHLYPGDSETGMPE